MPKVKTKKKLHTIAHKAKTKVEGDKIEDFVNSLQLNEMWEEYAHGFNSNGTPKYKTVWSYISKFTKVPRERDILYWMLGPKVILEDEQIPKYKLEQYDWEARRQQGFWYSSKNIETLKSDISRKASAYESVKQAGKVNVDTIAMLNGLLRQLDEEFGGRLFLPDLSMKENTLRAQLYMMLVEKITTISNQAQLMYARTQGLDLERLDQFFSMFGTSMGRTASMLMGQTLEADSSGINPLTKQYAKVVEMVTAKASEYDLPIPDDIAAAIQEVQQEVVQEKKSRKVN